jgi:putative membrane protein
MKRIIIQTMALGTLAFLFSCGGADTDSKQIADSTNQAKIDSAKKADTTASTQNNMAELKPDAKFAVAAADGGMLEVQLGKLAIEKGTTTQIKKLGALMVKDHSKANEELAAKAKEKNITLPATLSDKCQKTLADLSEKNGKAFDKAYADLMVSDHKEDIGEFKKEAENGNDSTMTQWARATIPTLEHHLSMSEQAKKSTDKE